MIISQTPLRVSFFGGGTDYPEYYRRHGGATLAATINKYTTITVHRITQLVDHSLRVHYSRVEAVRAVDEIDHPSARECLRFIGVDSGIEIHYVADLPARTGLGSSSSSTVGLLHALHAFAGRMVTREQLAREAVHVEQNLIRGRVGSQDQYACAFGGLVHLVFEPSGRVHVTPVAVTPERLGALERRLLLLYTGIQRHAHEVLDEQTARTQSGENDADLGKLAQLVPLGLEILTSGDRLTDFGVLLHEGWTLKRRLSSRVTTAWIDEVYERARGAGAVGGKLLGAGGGGFLLLYVEPEERQRVLVAVPELREVTFAFEDSGSRIVFYRP
jgi:D-glycero-alpha-D-manno-heptose-7-phosphate kinase